MINKAKLTMALLACGMLVIFTGCGAKEEPKVDDGRVQEEYTETVTDEGGEQVQTEGAEAVTVDPAEVDYRALYARAIDAELGEDAKNVKYKMIDIDGNEPLELFYTGDYQNPVCGVIYINPQGKATVAKMQDYLSSYEAGGNLFFIMHSGGHEFYSFINGEFVCTDSGYYTYDLEKATDEERASGEVVFNGEKMTGTEYQSRIRSKLEGHNMALIQGAVVGEDGKLYPPELASYDEIMAELKGE